MLEISLPGQMEMVKCAGGFRFRGSAAEIVELSEDLRRISELPPGGFALLEGLELVVADSPSRFDHRIAIPAEAWID